MERKSTLNTTLGVIFRGRNSDLEDMIENVESMFGVTIVYKLASNSKLYITENDCNNTEKHNT